MDECYKHALIVINGQVLPAPVGSGHSSEISVCSSSRAAGSKPMLSKKAASSWSFHATSVRTRSMRSAHEIPPILVSGFEDPLLGEWSLVVGLGG